MQKNRCHGFIYGLVAIGLVTSLLSSTDQAQAASGNGPYYATPSWDQKLPASTRFVVLTDWNSEAVLDRETGLVWERAPGLTHPANWSFARFDCSNRTTGGRRAWRLPLVHELASLMDPFTFFNSGPYWSATTDADGSDGAWVVNFEVTPRNPFVPGVMTKNATNPVVWCVRGPMNADTH